MRSTAPHIPQSKASIEAAPKEAASREAASKEEVSKEAASKEALLLRAKRPGSERRFKGSGRGGREKYCDLSPGPGIQGVSADLRVEGGGDAHQDPARMFPVPVRELPGPSPRDPGPGPSAPLNRSGSSRTGGAWWDGAKRGGARRGGAGWDGARRGGVGRGGVGWGGAGPKAASNEAASKEEASKEEASKEAASKDEASKEIRRSAQVGSLVMARVRPGGGPGPGGGF